MTQQGNIITADEGKTFRRIHDGFVMGNVIYLGIDYSLSPEGREDLPEYYEEIDEAEELFS